MEQIPVPTGDGEPRGLVGAPAREVLRRAEALAAGLTVLDRALEEAAAAVVDAWAARVQALARRRLADIPVDALRESTQEMLLVRPLEAAGFRTVLDVLDADAARIEEVPGVGPKTAERAVAAARQVAAAVAENVDVRLDPEEPDAEGTAVLAAVAGHEHVRRAVGPWRTAALTLGIEMPDLIRTAGPARGRLRRLFSGGRRRREADAALGHLEAILAWADARGADEALARAVEEVRGAVVGGAEALWREFARRPADVYGLLADLVDIRIDLTAARGYLPEEVVEAVGRQALDESLLRVNLRGYQAFGARFVLVQGHAILGDEMGLGKTVQAIAVMAHLAAEGATHFLVVAPASVLVNWTREVAARSALRAYAVHGDRRESAFAAWAAGGGVAVTTFEQLHLLFRPPGVEVALFVADEAHYAKNPTARRSRAVRSWCGLAERALLMSGTPMENRVEEFRNLVDLVNPVLAASIDATHAVAGPEAFRRSVAPVYLRRNAEDVLRELPDLEQVEEWEEFTRADLEAYHAAVGAGNFMAMRRAAFAAALADGAPPEVSAKLDRLVEILEEAGENGRKVVVFSYFLDVLDVVARAVPGAVGPLTGSVPVGRRQEMVDRFLEATGPAVLVAQILTGGVGLNLQAASVVVLCEPQVKPTTEAQAVRRVHRMGQAHPVQVHRLLVADSVDERMLEILRLKEALFDAFARRSDVAEATPDAVDVTEVDLARRLVAEERARLGVGGTDG